MTTKKTPRKKSETEAAPKKKAPRKKAPAITLRDPVSEKKADLTDDQGVRTVLVNVINRIGPADVWRSRLPDDSTERVTAQILRRCDGVAAALDLIKKALTIHEIFQGTELEEHLKKIPKKITERLVGVTGEEGRDLLLADVTATFLGLWPKLEAEILEGEGEKSRQATITIKFFPESQRNDARFDTEGTTKAGTRVITRTSKVAKLKGGRFQLELFKSPAEK